MNGARQVGKTWLVNEFGHTNYDRVAHVVLLDNHEMAAVFDRTLDPDRILDAIGVLLGIPVSNGNTLVFFDEIQECPRAITSLKLFCEQRPDIPVIAAGSLLGVALHQGAQPNSMPAPISWPVGKVDYLDMHPMTFLEFLDATGDNRLADLIRAEDLDLLAAFHDKLLELLRLYFYVGGMPEAVASYIASSDISAARRVQTRLLRDYEHDFAKHVKNAEETEHIRRLWQSIPAQLARETDTHRFLYSHISEGARGRDYRSPIQWLEDAGLVTKVAKIKKPGIPLSAYVDETYFKLYLLDIGLLGAATNLSSRTLLEDDRLFTEYKGVYAEQYICQQLIASNRCVPYYWSADGKSQKGEVDFIYEYDGAAVPVEIKANDNVHGKSIASFVEKNALTHAIRFSALNWKDQDWLLNVPLYAANLFPRSIA